MFTGLDYNILIIGLVCAAARVCDVSIGTIRTISIVNGRTTLAFFLGLIEVSLWLVVISTVLDKIREHPIVGVFYALGFALGNVIGIKLEKRMSFGFVILRVISTQKGREIAQLIRKAGFAVTVFEGEGQFGPVLEDCIVCRRKDLRAIKNMVRAIEPEAFYITEQAGEVSRIYRPMMTPATGWRAIIKRK